MNDLLDDGADHFGAACGVAAIGRIWTFFHIRPAFLSVRQGLWPEYVVRPGRR
jgi:hypothetical protein